MRMIRTSVEGVEEVDEKQVHSLCVDLRPGDRLRLAKGPPHHSHPSLFCQAQSEAHGPPSAMAVRKTRSEGEGPSLQDVKEAGLEIVDERTYVKM